MLSALTNKCHLSPQLIFRKVADVKKEKELAEKRKNDPPLDLANDHPVRKLISRFRKISDTKHDVKVTNMSDLERGATPGPADPDAPAERPGSGTRVITVSENPNVTSAPRLGGGSSKWGKLLGGATSGSSSTDPDSNSKSGSERPIPLNDLSPKIESRVGEGPKVSTKPMSKWGRLMGKPQEPIEESPEEDLRSNLKKTDSNDSGILKSSSKLDQIGHDLYAEAHGHPIHTALNINTINNLTKETVSNSSNSTNASSGSSSIAPAVVSGGLSAAEQHMLTSLYDIRLEIKEELDSLRQKMNRIDEHISEVLRFFSPVSTPCSSVSTYPSSKFNSPHNITSSNSAEQSPKNSVSSSPRHDEGTAENSANLSGGEMAPLNIASTVLPQEHSPALRQNDFQQAGPTKGAESSKRSTPKERKSSGSAENSRRSSKSSNSSNESHKHSSGTPEPVPGRIHGSTQVDILDDDGVVFQDDNIEVL